MLVYNVRSFLERPKIARRSVAPESRRRANAVLVAKGLCFRSPGAIGNVAGEEGMVS